MPRRRSFAVTNPFSAVRVSEHVYWVGAVDWAIKEFHGYSTPRGTTYNAFLVLGEPVTLVDTVKAPFVDEMLARVASVVPLDRVRLLVSNHSEMDHSGALPVVIDRLRPDRVLASAKGKEALDAHFGLGDRVEAVASGGEVSLGSLTLAFLETRMLHWPDSMFTFLKEERVLFSQDAFGMHLASSQRFADELPEDVCHREAAKYFANILMPFAPLVTRLLGTVESLGLAFDVIAPDHGPIYRRDPGWIVGRYGRWAALRPSRKAVVVYDTMWGSTAKMARAVGEGLDRGGAAPVEIMPLESRHRSDVATQILDAGALVVGSPTMNNQLYPRVADVLAYLEGLKPRHLIGAAFGSHGWSGEAVCRIEDALDRMKIERVAPSVKVRYVPDVEALGACRDLGRAVAEALCGRPAAVAG
jgi:flavorubredoxin